MPAVSVIMPAWNASATIERALEALASQEFGDDFEIVVGDDGSTDGTVEVARAFGDLVTVVEQERQGPGPARNLAVSASSGGILAFTDADCFPRPDWLSQGVAALESADLVQGMVIPDPDTIHRAFDHSITITHEYGLYETANLFCSRELFDRIGGFEDWLMARIGKPLGEDVWFGWKARRSGARTAFCESALVYHAVIPRGGRDYIVDRVRRMYMCDLVEKVPELRDTWLFGGHFLSRRTAEYDAALAAALLAGAAIRFGAGPAAALPLVAALPYSATVLARAIRMGKYGPRVTAVDLVADTVGFGALVWGSLRRRTIVL